VPNITARSKDNTCASPNEISSAHHAQLAAPVRPHHDHQAEQRVAERPRRRRRAASLQRLYRLIAARRADLIERVVARDMILRTGVSDPQRLER
jgi:hypothetical protein